MVLRATFPRAALKVTPVANSVMISGFVDQAEQIDRIIRIAEEYYPKVINNMTVGGVQTVLLHVKVMEVSRTKLRQLGFDWAKITGSNMVTSGASGMILPPSSPALPSGVPGTGTPPCAQRTSNNPINGDLRLQRGQRRQRVLRRAERPAAGQPAEDPLRADAGRRKRPGGVVQLSAAKLPCPSRKASAASPFNCKTTARRSTLFPSCWATARSTWRCGPA